MDHQGTRESRPRRLSVAHPEVRGPAGGVPVRGGGEVAEVAKAEGATSYDCEGDELGHHGKECSFDAIVKKYGLGKDPAIVLLAKIVNGADTDNTRWNQPEAAGLKAIRGGVPAPRVPERHGAEQGGVDRLRRAVCVLSGGGEARGGGRELIRSRIPPARNSSSVDHDSKERPPFVELGC